MNEPKCPECGVWGMENIVTKPSVEERKRGESLFHVVFCKKCGHVYGVFAKDVLAHNMGVF